MSTGFETEIIRVSSMIEPSDYELAPETVPIIVESVREIDDRYGPGSDHRLPYHNALHAVNVARRAVRLTNILYPYIQPDYKQEIYDLAMLAGATHDYEQGLGSGVNERVSTESVLSKVEAANGNLNTDSFKQRLALGILSTTVELDEDGRLIQVNVPTGDQDPVKFITSFADINGIAMEGTRRMMQDATNLYYELADEPTVQGLYNFYINQAAFLRQRLNDSRIKPDIRYYFPNDAEAVYADLHTAFHGNIVSAYGLALLLGEKPELQRIVDSAVRAIGEKPMLGTTIGKVLARKLVSKV